MLYTSPEIRTRHKYRLPYSSFRFAPSTVDYVCCWEVFNSTSEEYGRAEAKDCAPLRRVEEEIEISIGSANWWTCGAVETMSLMIDHCDTIRVSEGRCMNMFHISSTWLQRFELKSVPIGCSSSNSTHGNGKIFWCIKFWQFWYQRRSSIELFNQMLWKISYHIFVVSNWCSAGWWFRRITENWFPWAAQWLGFNFPKILMTLFVSSFDHCQYQFLGGWGWMETGIHQGR